MMPLRPSKPNKCEIVGFDTEDNGLGAPDNFLCASFYNITTGAKHIFYDRTEAREYLLAKKRMLTLFFAHNLQYDISNLDFPEGTIHIFFRKSGIAGGKHENSKYLDTGNFYAGKLEKLGKIIGVEKLNYDASKLYGVSLENLSEKEKQELGEYCLRDAEICAKIGQHLIKMADEYKIKFRCFTAASLSHRIFRRTCLPKEIKPRGNPINDIERLAYYGGRTEVFDFKTHKRVLLEDINSSYPAAMLKTLPNPASCSIIKSPKPKDIEGVLGITYCKVKAPDIKIPVLPYRTEDKKLIFPKGEWIGMYANPELELAISEGYKIEPIFSIAYYETFNYFKQFVEHFYGKKNKSEGIEKLFYKIVLNSLYGKFGEIRHEIIRKPFELLTSDELNMCSGAQEEQSGWISMVGKRLPDASHSFPVIAAYVTAYGRIKLYEERLREIENPIYCDTDSMISEEDTQINVGDNLGQWKTEEAFDFKAFAPKFYTCNGKLKIKGIPASAKKIGEFEYEYKKPIKLAESIRRKMKPNEWITVIKKLRLQNDKRKINPDGTTEPLAVFASKHIISLADVENAFGIMKQMAKQSA